jgi:hypothetical protein
VFDEKIVFHSNLKGAHIEWLNSFKQSSQIVYELDIDLPLDREEALYQSIINANDGKKYDYAAFLLFIFQVVRYRFTGKKRTDKNTWQDKRALLCTGLADYLPLDIFPQLAKVNDLEIISPYQLFFLLANPPEDHSAPL